MPPPDDRWSTSSPGSGSGYDGGQGSGQDGGRSGGPHRPRRRWPVALGLVSALVLTGVVATLVVVVSRPAGRTTVVPPPAASTSNRTQPVGAPTSGSPTPTPSATPVTPASESPTAAPQDPVPRASDPPSSPPGPDRSLKTNSVYGVDLGRVAVSCDLRVRRPKPPLANGKLEAYLNDVVGCLTRVFRAPLAARGFDLVEPEVKTYHRKVDSPCGDFDQKGSPAYYCSTTRTIYWPDTVDDGREAYTFARLGYVGLTAHEFGHHLQASTGMLWAYARAEDDAGSAKARYALSRRLELQAQCFEGVFLHAVRKQLKVSTEDRAELEAWHGYTGDEDPPDSRKPDHGSSKAQWAWLERGLDSGDVGACNTWTASKKSVT